MTDASAAAPVVILDQPQLAENIGAAARVMANFGLSELRLVAPRGGGGPGATPRAATTPSSTGRRRPAPATRSPARTTCCR